MKNLKSTKFWLSVASVTIPLLLATILLWHHRITNAQWVDVVEFITPMALIVYGAGNVLSKGLTVLQTYADKTNVEKPKG